MNQRLQSLFGVFQTLLETRAIEGSYDNRTMDLGFNESPSEHWIIDLFRIEQSPEFIEIALLFATYRASVISEKGYDSSKMFPGIRCLFHGAIDKCQIGRGVREWRSLPLTSPDDCVIRSAFGLWCRASGLYYAKYVLLDRSDWTPKFQELLECMPTELGESTAWLIFDGMPKPRRPSRSRIEIVDLDPSWFRSIEFLQRSKEAIQNDEITEIHFRDVRDFAPRDASAAVRKKLSFHVTNSIREPEYERSRVWASKHPPGSGYTKEERFVVDWSRTLLKRKKSVFDLFLYERYALQLCATRKRQFECVLVCSNTRLEDVFWGFSFPHPCLSSGVYHDSESLSAEKLSALLSSDDAEIKRLEDLENSRDAMHGRLLDCIYDLVTRDSVRAYRLLNSLKLFDKANLALDEVVEFINYVSSLESLLASAINRQIGDRIKERFSRMTTENNDQRIDVSEKIAKVYERRTNIVHGKTPDVNERPFADIIPSHELRNYCRRALITVMFALDRLQRDRRSDRPSPLMGFLSSRDRRIPMNKDELCSLMSEFENNNDFWAAFRETVDIHCACFGFTTDVIFA